MTSRVKTFPHFPHTRPISSHQYCQWVVLLKRLQFQALILKITSKYLFLWPEYHDRAKNVHICCCRAEKKWLQRKTDECTKPFTKFLPHWTSLCRLGLCWSDGEGCTKVWAIHTTLRHSKCSVETHGRWLQSKVYAEWP